MKSKFVEKLGDNYKVLNGRKTVNLINEALKKENYGEGLTPQQEKCLKNAFGDSGMLGNLDMPFIAYAWEKEKPEGKNVFWRLSYPILLFWGIIVIIFISPIKWIFTGKSRFSQDSALARFNVKWYNKCTKRDWCE